MTLSADFRAELEAVDDGDGLLLLAVMDDIRLTAPVRVANSTRNWTIGGVSYAGIPMDVTLPSDVPQEAARAQVEISNVGRELIAELEALPLGTAGLDLTLRIVSRVRPEQIEWEFVAPISRITATAARVVIVLGDDNLTRQSAVLLRFDPTTAPGLFAG